MGEFEVSNSNESIIRKTQDTPNSEQKTKLKCVIYWWKNPKEKNPERMQKQEFEDFYSDKCDVFLDQLFNDDTVSIIEIKKFIEVGV